MMGGSLSDFYRDGSKLCYKAMSRAKTKYAEYESQRRQRQLRETRRHQPT